MLPMIKNILRLPRARLSRRLVWWVFVSVVVIEGIILIPSYGNRRQELLAHLKALSLAEVSLLAQTAGLQTAGTPHQANELIQLIRTYLLKGTVTGGRLYDGEGREMATFGESPRLEYEALKARNQTTAFEGGTYRYDVAHRIMCPVDEYTLILRHDTTSVKNELMAFILRIGGLVLIISFFVTAGAWLALGPLVITPILKLRQDLQLAGDAVRRDKPAPEFASAANGRRDELGEVIVAFTRMFDQIQAAIAERKQAETSLQHSLQQVEAVSQALNEELEKGRRIQHDFLPSEFPQHTDWEIAAMFVPARQVSGDFYDVFPLPGGLIGLAIGDVADKGVGAALYMALIRSLIRVFSGHYQFSGRAVLPRSALINCHEDGSLAGNPEEILKAVDLTNAYLVQEHGDEGMFASLFFGVLDPATGYLTYVNGGHEPLFITAPESSNKLWRLPPTDPAVGVLPGHEFQTRQVRLHPGATLVGYTDGVSEARSPMETLYTRSRLAQALEKNPAGTAADHIAAIKADLLKFIGDASQADDITILAVYRKNSQ